MGSIRPYFQALPIFFAAASQAYAADQSDIEQMQQQLQTLQRQNEMLRRQNEVQNGMLQAFESRLSQINGNRSTTGATPDRPPRQSTNTSQGRATASQTQPREEARAAPTSANNAENAPAETVRKEPELEQSVQAVVADTHGLFNQRLTFEPALTYSYFDRSQVNLSGFLILDSIFLGNISVDKVENSVLTLDLTTRYGFSDRAQADLKLPFVYRSQELQSGGAGGASTSLINDTVDTGPSLGDVEAGFSYRVLPETVSRPDVVWRVRAKAPTGTDPFGIETMEVPGSEGNLTIPKELPTGTGAWRLSTGLSLLKTLDPVVVFGSVDYFYNLKASFNDIDPAEGKQPGEVAYGDSWEFGMGFAVAFNERTSISMGYSQRFIQETEIKAKGGDWSTIIGSDANIAQVSLGLTYALDENVSIITSIGAGLTSDAPDVQLGIRVPYLF